MGKLQGKVVFVAGGSQGIGEQTALLFGRERASVAVVASSDLAKAENVAKCIRAAGGKASAHVAEVRDAKQVAKAVAEAVAAHGPIDILINSAGVFPPTPAGDTPEEVYDKVMDINVKATWNTICAIAPSMVPARRGGSSIFRLFSGRWRSPTMPSIARAFAASGPFAVPASVQWPCDAGNSHAMHMVCQPPNSWPIMSTLHPPSKRAIRGYPRQRPDASVGSK